MLRRLTQSDEDHCMALSAVYPSTPATAPSSGLWGAGDCSSSTSVAGTCIGYVEDCGLVHDRMVLL